LFNPNDSGVGALERRPRHDEGYHEGGGCSRRSFAFGWTRFGLGRGFIETMLEEELSEALSRPRYGRRKPGEDEAAPSVVGVRLGTFEKTRIAVPCARLTGGKDPDLEEEPMIVEVSFFGSASRRRPLLAFRDERLPGSRRHAVTEALQQPPPARQVHMVFGSFARTDHSGGSDPDLLMVNADDETRHVSVGHLSMFLYPWLRLKICVIVYACFWRKKRRLTLFRNMQLGQRSLSISRRHRTRWHCKFYSRRSEAKQDTCDLNAKHNVTGDD
jgi:predicted nucleotidyltransferase